MLNENLSIGSNMNKISPRFGQDHFSLPLGDSVPMHHCPPKDRVAATHLEHGVVLDSSYTLQTRPES